MDSAPVTDIDTALAQLAAAADVLPADAYDELDSRGFLRLPGLIDQDWLHALRVRLDQLRQAEGAAGGQVGAAVLADLFNKGEVFERMLRTPPVLAAARHVLGDFRVNSLNFRAALPGQGQQDLHSDTGVAGGGGNYQVCNSIWLIDDFTDLNGATRAVPRSHWSHLIPGEAMPDPAAPHPEETLITGNAGDVVVFNAHVWHGGTTNHTLAPRRGMTLSFCRTGRRQQLNQAEYIRKAVHQRFSPAERFLLDV